ncbi:unnamed protein product [Brassica oleracea]
MTAKRRPLPGTCHVPIGERSGDGVNSGSFHFSFFFFFLFSPPTKCDSLPLRGSRRGNGDSSIGGSRRRRKTETFLSFYRWFTLKSVR